MDSFQQPPSLLIPSITFEVRKVVEALGNVGRLSQDEWDAVAREIRMASVPMLFSFDIDADRVAEMSPVIERAAVRAMRQISEEGSSVDQTYGSA